MKRILTAAVVIAAIAAIAAPGAVRASAGTHTTNGTATNTISQTLSVLGATEPGSGTAIAGGNLVTITCMQAVVLTPPGAPGHEVFMRGFGLPANADGTLTDYYIYIVDFVSGTDQFGYVTTPVAPPGAPVCQADQNTFPVTSGLFTTLP